MGFSFNVWPFPPCGPEPPDWEALPRGWKTSCRGVVIKPSVMVWLNLVVSLLAAVTFSHIDGMIYLNGKKCGGE